jgi:heme exporter protein D
MMDDNFFAMGGYAVYVWGSYAITAIVLVANAWWPRRWERSLLAAIARRAEQEQRTP